MTSAPSGLARKAPTVPEHECAHLLTMHTQRFNSGGSCAHEIAHRFMAFVQNPNGCQFAASKQISERDRVVTVGLDPIARLTRNERGRHHCDPRVRRFVPNHTPRGGRQGKWP